MTICALADIEAAYLRRHVSKVIKDLDLRVKITMPSVYVKQRELT